MQFVFAIDKHSLSEITQKTVYLPIAYLAVAPDHPRVALIRRITYTAAAGASESIVTNGRTQVLDGIKDLYISTESDRKSVV